LLVIKAGVQFFDVFALLPLCHSRNFPHFSKLPLSSKEAIIDHIQQKADRGHLNPLSRSSVTVHPSAIIDPLEFGGKPLSMGTASATIE
jgi:hypothetical protein